MIGAEEQVSKEGAPAAHHHVLIEQCRLGNGVDKDLEEERHNHYSNSLNELF